MTMRQSGFTLIELLIVVAIIAILAAIAVPNFLEAQVRSKVSRVRSDHRSLATAIESYYVDNNAYPAGDTSGGATAFGCNKIPGASNAILSVPVFRVKQNLTDNLMTLTTPVAYITSIFSDPFADTRGASFMYALGGDGITAAAGSAWMVWSFGPDGDEAQSTVTPDRAKLSATANGTAGDTPWRSVGGRATVSETVYSASGTIPSPGLLSITYDPSNGTTSNGDVWRLKQ